MEYQQWLVLFSIVSVSNGANILFLFGGGNLSHKISIWPFVIGLANKGHNVTFVSSSEKIISTHERVTDMTPTSFKDYTASLYTNVDRIQERIDGKQMDIIEPIYDAASETYCHVLFDAYEQEPSFRSLFDRKRTDLIILNVAYQECAYYLIYSVGVKYIAFSSSTLVSWFHQPFGAPFESSSIPDLTPNIGFPPNLFDRMASFWRTVKGFERRPAHVQKMEEIYKSKVRNGVPTPSILEMEKNASLVFLNSHYSIDFARSLPPVFINIGGMQCWSEVGQLPVEFEEFMSGAEAGVVLITFGSTINFATLDTKYRAVFFKMMEKFDKFRFIWRWDGPPLENSPPNLLSANWLPQREILNHPKTVAFMTHGGLNSINEATYHGVPLIVLPLFADQDFNAYRIRAQGLGVSIEFRDFSQELMDEAVGKVLSNGEYKKRMMVRSKLFIDRPRSPIEEAIGWTEFVLRQDDTSALKPMLLDQPWWIRNYLDIYIAYFFVFLLFPLSIVIIFTKCIKAKFN